ncbi:Isopenicillin N synthase [Halomicronema hongdechloris C2206]|uniref:Isopenicillin N synthase n=1 Tax=Halomicronema hongdechloris C2206 TaxID=1641165 RepID=A0A1Z3HMV8_9CYAN|nr:2-oxoglutarate and iron-dependent oxygenase domain-containing protein [Halomicronema hongdechloris]ASC71606.1 Isopenicillin N synthase [Halomicronema hongdechloris C2206]
MISTIPCLDLQDYRAEATTADFVDALGQALAEVGFFVLANPGIDAQLIASAYEMTQRFFELPLQTKLQYEHPDMKGQGGFTRFGREHAKDCLLPDLKEFWHVNRCDLESANAPWPAEVPGFRPAMISLYGQLDACAAQLLEVCALYLGQSRTWLQDMVIGGKTVLRLAHYPPVPAAAPPGSLRAAPHEDINFITLLCEATAPGLEIHSRDGRWLPVQAAPGQIIVDTGDMLQNLTNGWLKSTTHRVVNGPESGQGRLSMPFFVHPRPQVDLSPQPDCVARTGGRERFPRWTAAAYLNQRLQQIGLAAEE